MSFYYLNYILTILTLIGMKSVLKMEEFYSWLRHNHGTHYAALMGKEFLEEIGLVKNGIIQLVIKMAVLSLSRPST